MLDTRARLVQAARRLFAERGFRNATVRDIAARAESNLASINYHFRSKEALYLEVLRQTFPRAPAEAPPTDPADASPAQRLTDFLKHVAETPDEGLKDDRARLLAWETLAPTGFIDLPAATGHEPHFAEASAVVRAFCGDESGPEIVTTGAYWLLGQCMLFRASYATGAAPDRQLAERLIRVALEAVGEAARSGAPALPDSLQHAE